MHHLEKVLEPAKKNENFLSNERLKRDEVINKAKEEYRMAKISYSKKYDKLCKDIKGPLKGDFYSLFEDIFRNNPLVKKISFRIHDREGYLDQCIDINELGSTTHFISIPEFKNELAEVRKILEKIPRGLIFKTFTNSNIKNKSYKVFIFSDGKITKEEINFTKLNKETLVWKIPNLSNKFKISR